MSFQQKNIAVSFINFSIILAFYCLRVFQLIQNNNFNTGPIFRLWGIIIILAVFVTIAATILTHIVSAILDAIKTGTDKPNIEDFKDERDELIDLKGTQITYTTSSIGVFFAMLAFVFGQSALVMFSLLIFFGLLAQIIGDTRRLILYERGF